MVKDKSTTRDDTIDVLRGYAMLAIAINHLTALLVELGLKGFPVPTLTSVGFSSAAEIFFLLSGLMVGMVHLRKPDRDILILKRAAEIYTFNAFAFFGAVLAAWAAGSAVAQATNADITLASPWGESLRFLLFLQHPELLGVLMSYVVFMLLTPLAARLLDRSLPAFLGVSVAIYLVPLALPQVNLPGGSPEGDLQWNFNPLSWQILFFAGMAAGRLGLHQRGFAYLKGNIRVTGVFVAALLAFAILHRLALREMIEVPFTDKESLGFMRLIHTGVVVATLSALIVNAPRVFKPALAWLAVNGRQTLFCFTASIPLTYALAGLWLTIGGGYLAYLTMVALMVAAITAISVGVGRWRKHRKSLMTGEILYQS